MAIDEHERSQSADLLVNCESFHAEPDLTARGGLVGVLHRAPLAREPGISPIPPAGSFVTSRWHFATG
jgi:hypothetical protein